MMAMTMKLYVILKKWHVKTACEYTSGFYHQLECINVANFNNSPLHRVSASRIISASVDIDLNHLGSVVRINCS